VSGVAGVVHLNGGPIDQSLLERILNAAGHRAHGKRELHIGAQAAFGHLQRVLVPPDSNTKRSGILASDHFTAVVDARLDNQGELTRTLGLSPGASPVEIVVAAYQRWRQGVAEHLLGDYTVIIWDAAQRRALLARDAVGLKTLHYAVFNDVLVVGSDAVQVRAFPGISQDLDPIALAGWAMGEPEVDRCLFKDIHTVPRGACVVIERGGVRTFAHWSADPAAPIRYRKESEYADHLAELLRTCVTDRLGGGDEVTAAELSGGMDSTSVAAIAAQSLLAKTATPLLACTQEFKTVREADETTLAGLVARHIGAQWMTFDADSHGALGFPADHQPTLESPCIFDDPTLSAQLAELHSRGVTRLLTGNGGDEVMCASNLLYAHRLARGDLTAVSELLRYCIRERQPIRRHVYGLLIEPLISHRTNARLRKLWGKPPPSALTRPVWFEASAVARFDLDAHYPPPTNSTVREMVRTDMLTGFTASGLPHVTQTYDVAAMPLGIEVSHPFADRRLLEFALNVPPHTLGARRP
jgi:asparagine synthase (glutamine-hydrolysing)